MFPVIAETHGLSSSSSSIYRPWERASSSDSSVPFRRGLGGSVPRPGHAVRVHTPTTTFSDDLPDGSQNVLEEPVHTHGQTLNTDDLGIFKFVYLRILF